MRSPREGSPRERHPGRERLDGRCVDDHAFCGVSPLVVYDGYQGIILMMARTRC